MEEEVELVHYKWGGNPTHANVSILPNGKDIEYIVIDHIEKRVNEKVNGQIKNGFVAVFETNPYTTLGLWLNDTNKRILVKKAGVKETEILKIKHLPVRLTYEDTKQFGWGLRVSKLPPVIPTTTPPKKETLTDQHENWAKCIAHIKGGGSIEDLKKKYEISPATEIKLKN